jgi:hypothetical protein
MTYPSLANGLTVTLVRRTLTGTQDEFGNDEYTSTNVDVWPCSVQPSTSREVISFTDQMSRTITAFLPSGTDVEYLDALIWNGDTYEVTGNPDTWQSPFSGHTAPVRVEATLVEGASP